MNKVKGVPYNFLTPGWYSIPILMRILGWVGLDGWLHVKMVYQRGIDEVQVLRPIRCRIGYFGYGLPSQSLGLVLKKLQCTQYHKSKQYKKKW